MFRQFIAGDAPIGREGTIDIIRGLCIASMVFAHVALGGIGFRATHAAIWYDGAMGFVLLSGLIVGLVHRRTVVHSGIRAETIKALKRAGVVYAAHITLCVLSFAVSHLFPQNTSAYASVSDVGGWWPSILATLTLQINPRDAAILSLYVVLLVLTPLAALLMHSRLTWLLVTFIVAVFVCGHLFPEQLTLPRYPGASGEINVANWQAIYFLAFIAGWHWKHARPRLSNPVVWAVATVIALSAVLYARVSRDAQRPEFVEWAFASGQMGPGTVVLAFAIIIAIFPVLTWFDRVLPDLTGIIARVGRRSLDSYIILAFIVLSYRSYSPYDRSTLAADAGAVGILALMWAWARLRDYRKAKLLARPRAEALQSDGHRQPRLTNARPPVED